MTSHSFPVGKYLWSKKNSNKFGPIKSAKTFRNNGRDITCEGVYSPISWDISRLEH